MRQAAQRPWGWGFAEPGMGPGVSCGAAGRCHLGPELLELLLQPSLVLPQVAEFGDRVQGWRLHV